MVCMLPITPEQLTPDERLAIRLGYGYIFLAAAHRINPNIRGPHISQYLLAARPFIHLGPLTICREARMDKQGRALWGRNGRGRIKWVFRATPDWWQNA